MNDMDIRQMRSFVTVAQQGSFTTAGRVLQVSQPALSNQIRALEEEFGTLLLLRHARGITLTTAGEKLLVEARSIVRQVDRLQATLAAESPQPRGELAFGGPPSFTESLFPSVVRQYHSRYPGVLLKMTVELTGELEVLLLRGEMDLCILTNPPSNKKLSFTPLVTEDLFLVGPPGSPLFRRRELEITDLTDLPLIVAGSGNFVRVQLERLAREEAVSLRIVAEVTNLGVPLIGRFVRDGLGYAVLTKRAVQDEFRPKEVGFSRLLGLVMNRVLARRADVPLSAAGLEMANLIRQEAKSFVK